MPAIRPTMMSWMSSAPVTRASRGTKRRSAPEAVPIPGGTSLRNRQSIALALTSRSVPSLQRPWQCSIMRSCARSDPSGRRPRKMIRPLWEVESTRLVRAAPSQSAKPGEASTMGSVLPAGATASGRGGIHAGGLASAAGGVGPIVQQANKPMATAPSAPQAGSSQK
jgi:hypothetical protein